MAIPLWHEYCCLDMLAVSYDRSCSYVCALVNRYKQGKYSGLHQEMHRALPSPPINNWKHTAGYPTGWRVVASIYARVYPPQCQLSPLAIRQWKLSPVWSGASVKAIAAKHVSSCSWRHTVCPRACLSLLLPLGQLPYQQLRPTLSSAMSAT